ncbi:MAG: glycosyltransferase family 4 protein [Candidatus Doudnabacteria bacterium]|nr:glycosyltransferase family 4 protein [Candidatus Doudnabacteria bacterium]
MKIGLDLRMLGGGSGISRYIFELAKQILTLDKKNEYVLFFNKLDEATKKEFSVFGQKMVETGIPHYSLAEQLKLPFIFNREKLDLLHVPHFNVPILYTGKFVTTIHDLTHTRFPGKKMSHLIHRVAYNLIMLNAVRRSDKIIAVSQSTKNELKQFFGVDEKIGVIYEGINESYRMMDRDEALAKIANRYKITKPFILYVGVWRRYKNLPALARVFDHLIEKEFDLELVLVGEPDPYYPEIEDQVRAIKHSDRIRTVGRVSDEDLNYFYNSCLMFVLPSLAEGFGLTALEAAACGAPVILSDIPTLREVMGQGAEYFDPANEENMYDVLSWLADNPQRRQDLSNSALARSKHYSWKKAAEETINLYESIK